MPYDLVSYSNRKRGSLSLNLRSSFPNLETLQSFKNKSALHTHKIKMGPLFLLGWEVYSSNLPINTPINIPVLYFLDILNAMVTGLKLQAFPGHLVFRALRCHALGGFAECCLLLQVWFNHLQGGTHFPQVSEGNLGIFSTTKNTSCCDLGHGKRWGKPVFP